MPRLFWVILLYDSACVAPDPIYHSTLYMTQTHSWLTKGHRGLRLSSLYPPANVPRCETQRLIRLQSLRSRTLSGKFFQKLCVSYRDKVRSCAMSADSSAVLASLCGIDFLAAPVSVDLLQPLIPHRIVARTSFANAL